MVPVLNLIIHSTPCSPTCSRYTLIPYNPPQSFPSGLSPLGFPTKSHLPLYNVCSIHAFSIDLIDTLFGEQNNLWGSRAFMTASCGLSPAPYC